MLVVLVRILLLLPQVLQPRRYDAPRRRGVHFRQARGASTRAVRAERRGGAGAIADGQRGAVGARGRGGSSLVEGQGSAPEGGGGGRGVGVCAAGGVGARVIHRRWGSAARVVIRKSRASGAVRLVRVRRRLRGATRLIRRKRSSKVGRFAGEEEADTIKRFRLDDRSKKEQQCRKMEEHWEDEVVSSE